MHIKGKFAVKWKNKIYKAVRVTRSKNCIVIAQPELPLHTTYPQGGQVHWTVENYRSHMTENKSGLRIVEKDNKLRMYFDGRPPIGQISSPIVLGTHAGFQKEYQAKPKDYELVDLDAFNCQTPNIQLFLAPPNQDSVDKIPHSYKGETKVVKFNDVWIVVSFIDVSQSIN